jgi:hypothetical protein
MGLFLYPNARNMGGGKKRTAARLHEILISHSRQIQSTVFVFVINSSISDSKIGAKTCLLIPAAGRSKTYCQHCQPSYSLRGEALHRIVIASIFPEAIQKCKRSVIIPFLDCFAYGSQ